MISVELTNIQLALTDQVKVANNGPSQRSHHTTIAGEKGQQACCIFDDIPGCGDDAKNRHEYRSTEDVDVLRCHSADVIRERERASSYLIPDRSQYKTCSSEELRCSTIEFRNDRGHVPFEFTPDFFVCGVNKMGVSAPRVPIIGNAKN